MDLRHGADDRPVGVTPDAPPDATSDPAQVCLVVGEFQARAGAEAALASVLARYVVLTRAEPGCRNVDLAVATGEPGTYLVVEKWAHHDALRVHLDGAVAVTMATDARAHLAGSPRLRLYDGVSAHDLT